jgi:amino acid transporter
MKLQGILKWPLIIAAVVVVLRVVMERAGAPVTVSNLLSVVALHTLLVPLYFAIRIGRSGVQRPYWMLIKLVAIYVVLTRAMIILTYWLARIYEWKEPRFAGLTGPGVTPFTGFIAIPFLTAALWISASLVVGGMIGTIVVAVLRSRITARQFRLP